MSPNALEYQYKARKPDAAECYEVEIKAVKPDNLKHEADLRHALEERDTRNNAAASSPNNRAVESLHCS